MLVLPAGAGRREAQAGAEQTKIHNGTAAAVATTVTGD
jgi:hypothetical protein